jgi:hypothetical protein
MHACMARKHMGVMSRDWLRALTMHACPVFWPAEQDRAECRAVSTVPRIFANRLPASAAVLHTVGQGSSRSGS